jgi:hypothetical protein
MTASRQWTREELDRVHPLPDDDEPWEWIEDGQTADGVQLWAAAVIDHDYGDPEVASLVSVDADGRLRFDGGDDEMPPADVALAVILASQGLDSREAMAAAMDSDEATARANAAALADASRDEPDLYVDAVRAVGCAEGFRHAAAMLRRGRVQS